MAHNLGLRRLNTALLYGVVVVHNFGVLGVPGVPLQLIRQVLGSHQARLSRMHPDVEVQL